MFKKILLFSIMLLMAAVFTFTVKSEAKMMNGKGMTKIEKMRKFRKMVMFFKRHSLGFIPIFYKYHPGPMWVVKHAKDLDLTPAQIKEGKVLQKEMFQKTKVGIMALKNAIRQYRTAAKQENPSIKGLITDVQAVGNAETYLGYEMIPFHIKAYRLLNASQKIKYTSLRKMMIKAYNMKMRHKMMMMRRMMKMLHEKMMMLHEKMMMMNR